MLAEVAQAKTMQLATSRDGQPWVCTVYFVLHQGNFYWLSFPERRHSQELASNANAAIAIALKTDVPVVGMQAEGTVEAVTNLDEVTTVLGLYVKKYNQGMKFTERFEKGENRHVLYRFSPGAAMTFDEESRPQDPYHPLTF